MGNEVRLSDSPAGDRGSWLPGSLHRRVLEHPRHRNHRTSRRKTHHGIVRAHHFEGLIKSSLLKILLHVPPSPPLFPPPLSLPRFSLDFNRGPRKCTPLHCWAITASFDCPRPKRHVACGANSAHPRRLLSLAVQQTFLEISEGCRGVRFATRTLLRAWVPLHAGPGPVDCIHCFNCRETRWQKAPVSYWLWHS